MKLKVYVSSLRLSLCHDAAQGSCHETDWHGDILGASCLSDCMEEQRGVNKSNLLSVSVSGQDQNICSCVKENERMIVCTLNYMMKWETWYDITMTKPFLWKIGFECCDGTYQIVLLDSWLVQTATPMMSFIWKEGHFSEIHCSIAQAQRKQIYDELLSPLTQPVLA